MRLVISYHIMALVILMAGILDGIPGDPEKMDFSDISIFTIRSANSGEKDLKRLK